MYYLKLFVVLFFLYIVNIEVFALADTTLVVNKNSNLILLTFNEPIKNEDLLNKSNYLIKDNTGKIWNIKLIGIVKGSNNNASDKVVLELDRLDYKKSYTIEVTNVRDTANNVIASDKNKITYYFDGLKTTLQKPSVKIYYKKLNIVKAVAKDTANLNFTPEKVFDGILFNPNSNIGRWASSPNPEWLIVELEKESYVDYLRISFFKFESGRIYNFSIDYSIDGNNWNSIGYMSSLLNKEFTEITIKKRAKFLRINIESQNQNSWSSIWEIEVFGN